MFTLAHMGLRQLTHNRSLYNEVNDAREVPENNPSFFFFSKKGGEIRAVGTSRELFLNSTSGGVTFVCGWS